jgi:hypothetical protein
MVMGNQEESEQAQRSNGATMHAPRKKDFWPPRKSGKNQKQTLPQDREIAITLSEGSSNNDSRPRNSLNRGRGTLGIEHKGMGKRKNHRFQFRR